MYTSRGQGRVVRAGATARWRVLQGDYKMQTEIELARQTRKNRALGGLAGRGLYRDTCGLWSRYEAVVTGSGEFST